MDHFPIAAGGMLIVAVSGLLMVFCQLLGSGPGGGGAALIVPVSAREELVSLLPLVSGQGYLVH